jgi:gluconolactonase
MKFAKRALAALPFCALVAVSLPALTAASLAQTAPAAAAAKMDIKRIDPALDAIIAPGVKPEKIAGGFIFVEGPMWNNGALYFSDLRGNKFFKMGPDNKPVMLLDKSGGLDKIPDGAFQGSNGALVDKDGSILLLQHGLRRIVRLDDKFKQTPVLERYQGKKLNSPNDALFTKDGAMWITDPPYGLLGQDKDPAKELKFNAVWRWKGGVLKPAITALPRPNGIGFSPDEKTLYISNSDPMFVNSYPVSASGTVGKPTRLITYEKVNGQAPPDVPDGLKVDSAGNIWTSGPGGIRIMTPKGKVLGQIVLPEVAANIVFGGPDLKTAYIMGSTSVYRLQAKVAGEKPMYQR